MGIFKNMQFRRPVCNLDSCCLLPIYAKPDFFYVQTIPRACLIFFLAYKLRSGLAKPFLIHGRNVSQTRSNESAWETLPSDYSGYVCICPLFFVMQGQAAEIGLHMSFWCPFLDQHLTMHHSNICVRFR